MCGLGRLYSKQSVIEHLLENNMPNSCSHIKSLKDIKNLKLTANPAYSPEDDKNAPFICALIGLEMSGQFRKYQIFALLNSQKLMRTFFRICCFMDLWMRLFRKSFKRIEDQYMFNLPNSIYRRRYCNT